MNRSDAPVRIEITGSGDYKKAINHYITSDSSLATNDHLQADKVRIEEREVRFDTLQVEAYSFNLIRVS